MFLHNQHFQIYDTFTFDSHQKNVRFWLQKSIKIIPQTYQNRCWFINKFFNRFLFNFGCILGSFWDAFGYLLAPKPGYKFLALAFLLCAGIFFVLEALRQPHSGPFLWPTSPLHRKHRYDMKVPIHKNRVLSIGLALPKRHFPPPPRTFPMVRAQSLFRIGKYDTKWTSTTYACRNGASWICLAFKAIQVDFISVFVERIGPRPKRILTIYRKIRYELRVLGPKYRFLSIGLALRRCHFSLHLELCQFFMFFKLLRPLVFKKFKVPFAGWWGYARKDFLLLALHAAFSLALL